MNPAQRPALRQGPPGRPPPLYLTLATHWAPSAWNTRPILQANEASGSSAQMSPPTFPCQAPEPSLHLPRWWSGRPELPEGRGCPATPWDLTHFCAVPTEPWRGHVPFLLDLTKDRTTASFSRPWKPSTDLISSSGCLCARLCLSRSTCNPSRPRSQRPSPGGLGTQPPPRQGSRCRTTRQGARRSPRRNGVTSLHRHVRGLMGSCCAGHGTPSLDSVTCSDS